MKVAVGLSGGVDSSVAAALLKEQGHEVVGITMSLWREGRYQGGCGDACFGPHEAEDIASARELCAQLNIPYHVFDCSDAYEKTVLDYFREEYLSGRTPNPCVRCNAAMKFGLLPRLARESGLAFDSFATGHYARVCQRNGKWHLLRGVDVAKDQSYFLYRLTQEQLSGILFPLGELCKADVRTLAARYCLAVKDKPESQDFYSGDKSELMQTPPRQGNIVDETGKVLGTHQGHWNFTIGQRRGLGVSSTQPLYVVDINACRNEVVLGPVEKLLSKRLLLTDCRWVSGTPPSGSVLAKIRSTSKPVSAHFADGVLVFTDGVSAAALGQSAVLYNGDEVLGGGVISRILKTNDVGTAGQSI
ncbi:MAG: tRNA 2-thiouridine(34) synthase MnmA [Victivallales bacterium]|nr:tRNA 2-thiouridine(34) synthase MnmA [Victivallales bacterium]